MPGTLPSDSGGIALAAAAINSGEMVINRLRDSIRSWLAEKKNPSSGIEPRIGSLLTVLSDFWYLRPPIIRCSPGRSVTDVLARLVLTIGTSKPETLSGV